RGFPRAAELGSVERVVSPRLSTRASAHPTGAEAVRHSAHGGVGDTAFAAEEPAGGANASGPAAPGGPGPAGAQESDETLTQLPPPSGPRRAAAFADQTQSAPAAPRMTEAGRRPKTRTPFGVGVGVGASALPPWLRPHHGTDTGEHNGHHDCQRHSQRPPPAPRPGGRRIADPLPRAAQRPPRRASEFYRLAAVAQWP